MGESVAVKKRLGFVRQDAGEGGAGAAVEAGVLGKSGRKLSKPFAMKYINRLRAWNRFAGIPQDLPPISQCKL